MFVTMLITICIGSGIVALVWNAHDRKVKNNDTQMQETFPAPKKAA